MCCKNKVNSTREHISIGERLFRCEFTHGEKTKCLIVLPVCEKCTKTLLRKTALSNSLSAVVTFLVISVVTFGFTFLVYSVFEQTWGRFLLATVLLSFISMAKKIYYSFTLSLQRMWDICMEQGSIPSKNILEIKSVNPELTTLQGDILLKGEGNFEVKLI